MDTNLLSGLMSNNLDISKLINNKDNKTIECRTIFGPYTPIYIDGKIISMSALHIGYSGKETKTLGISPTSQTMEKCSLLEIPKEIYVENSVRISFGPGIMIECGPSAKILMGNETDYKPVSDLEKGDEILVTKWNSETGQDFVEPEPIADISKNNFISQIKVPMYAIITEFENVFIPYPVKGSPIVWTLNFHQ